MTDLINFTLVNETTKTAILYSGVSTTLDLVLVNNTGATVGLTGDPKAPSTLTFYLPDGLFNPRQVPPLSVTVAGWSAVVDLGAPTITVTCTADASWPDNGKLVVTVANALTMAAPAPSFQFALAPDNLKGNIPPQVNAELAVTLPPVPGNLPLPDVLQLTLDNQGLVYCTDKNNTLVNQLVLTLKNVGELALAIDKSLPGNPQVKVSFVYGQTGGSLAPDTGSPSAWGITGTVQSQPPKAAWTPPGPPTPGKKKPEWLFEPSEGNLAILDGVRTDSANVSFVFDQVVTNATPGHTQMLVLCTGFRKDSTKGYDDHLYVLDINKQQPPPTLGVLAFSAEKPVITVSDPNSNVDIPLGWTTFGAASATLLTSWPSVGLIPPFASPKGAGLLVYGKTTLHLDPPETSQALFLTLQAMNSAGGYLGSAQYTAFVQVSYVQDPDGWTYPVGLFGNHYWTLADYAYVTEGAYYYNQPAAPAPPKGTTRLYTIEAARSSAPPGWTLPSVADWQSLLDVFHTATEAYSALLAGGPARFAAKLGGFRPNSSYSGGGTGGYYWTTSATDPITQFSATSQKVFAGVPWNGGSDLALAVRYVRPA